MKFIERVQLELNVQLVLTEDEAGALDAIIGYTTDSFLTVFYKEMGEAYLKPHEKGFRSLCEHRGELKAILERAVKARQTFNAEGRK